ncbi:hypothetical protein KAU11_01025, partial [Candidatus Babeliales bacterium]|nr:hypothetical protein [Candidatus Babeliales bacterium]
MKKNTFLSIFALCLSTFWCFPQAPVAQDSIQANEMAAFESVLDTLLRGYEQKIFGTNNDRFAQRTLAMLKNDIRMAKLAFVKLNTTNLNFQIDLDDLIDFFFDNCEEKKLYPHQMKEVREILENLLEDIGYSYKKNQLRSFLMTLNRVFREVHASEYTTEQAIFNTCVRAPAHFVVKNPVAVMAAAAVCTGVVFWYKNRSEAVLGANINSPLKNPNKLVAHLGCRARIRPAIETTRQIGGYSCGLHALANAMNVEVKKLFKYVGMIQKESTKVDLKETQAKIERLSEEK